MHRWAVKILPVLAAVFRRRKRLAGKSWRMDETYIKVAGQGKYLYRAVDRDGHTIANTAAILSVNADSGADIELRQRKYLNNIVEQDHRAIKRSMLGFKSFRCTRALIAGIELMHMIKKGQLDCAEGQKLVCSIEVLLAGILIDKRQLGFARICGVTATEPPEACRHVLPVQRVGRAERRSRN